VCRELVAILTEPSLKRELDLVLDGPVHPHLCYKPLTMLIYAILVTWNDWEKETAPWL